ncbi:MAG: ATP-binding protein [Euryarchaeota archaeon]|nr:ATP-binding protein [Euryarchaeota archaeon]MDE1837391.1 ATP-binding protein [Euryarchaeota archaeon]MDE2045509.1 ATP-binding protein [Thermoplasmata archaeon]
MFVGRLVELEHLSKYLSIDRPQMVRVLGRRRVGKTDLLLKFLEGREARYLLVPDLEPPLQLQALGGQLSAGLGAGPKVYGSWDTFLDDLEEDRRPLVVFDEFQNLLRSGSPFLSRLQDRWDRRWQRTGPSLILCGSSIGMMQRLSDAKGAPLFGRLTADFHVRPLPYREARDFHPQLPEEERVRRFAVFGGTPFYQSFALRKTLGEAIELAFLLPQAPLRDEPEALLRQEFSDPTRANSILQQVGAGTPSLHDLETRLGVPHGGLSYYLRILENDMDLLQRSQPVLRAQRLGRYQLLDPMLRFYYRFIGPHLDLIAQGHVEEVRRRIEQDLESYVGQVFEEVALEWLAGRPEVEGRRLDARQLGRWWDRTGNEIDVVAVGEREVWVGEVKWSSQPEGERTVYRLLEKLPFLGRFPDKVVRPFLLSRGGVDEGAEKALRRSGGFSLTLDHLSAAFAR